MADWLKKIASWQIGRTLYLSVPFTWLMPEALKAAKAHKDKGAVQAGGPAVQLMPEYLANVAIVNEPCPVEPLLFHNPLATFTSRGCPNQCEFCAVPKLEGDFKELKSWRLAPIICDNNLLAASQKHFNKVIERLKRLPFVDFNQGLDAHLLKPNHVRRIAELKKVKVRFAFDHINNESKLYEAIKLCRGYGLNNFGIYVLLGFKDSPEDALYRLEKVRSWGIQSAPMRYQPLDGLEKNKFVAPGWTERQLLDMTRFFYGERFFGTMSFPDYNPRPKPLLDWMQEVTHENMA